MDTVSFAWRPDDDPLWFSLETAHRALPSGLPVRRQGFGAWGFVDEASGVRWRVDQRNRLIYCEGRLAPMLGAEPRQDVLGDFARLLEAAQRQAHRFTELAADHWPTGRTPPGYTTLLNESGGPRPQRQEFRAAVALQPQRCRPYYLRPDFELAFHRPVLRRLDLAAEVSFDDPALGLEALRVLDQVAASTKKSNRWGSRGRIETVSFYSGKRIWFRAYDSGEKRRLEGRGTAAPGTRLRFERQLTWSGDRRPPLALAATQDPAQLWGDRLAEIVGGPKTVLAAGDAAITRIAQLLDAGEIRPESAERLAGFVALAGQRGASWWADLGRAQPGYRRVRELKQLGIVLIPATAQADAQTQSRSLHTVLDCAARAWSASAGGSANPSS